MKMIMRLENNFRRNKLDMFYNVISAIQIQNLFNKELKK